MTSLDQPVSEDGETALGDLLASERSRAASRKWPRTSAISA